MACTAVTLSGIPLDCGNIGGIKNVWLINDNALVVSQASGELWIGYNSDKTLAQYSFRKGNASMTSTGNKDDKNGTYFVKTDLNLSFNKMDKGKRDDIEKIAKTNCYAIVEDNNGTYHLLGKESYLALATVNGQSGVNMSDANQYTLVLSSDTKELPDMINDRIMTLMTQYDNVWGGTVENGDSMYLQINAMSPFTTTGINEYSYAKKPDNGILSGSPALAQQYLGESGSVVYFIPKTATTAIFNETDGIYSTPIRGSINTNRVNSMNFSYNTNLTRINAPFCKHIIASNCDNLSSLVVSPTAHTITAVMASLAQPRWIGDIIRNAYINAVPNAQIVVQGQLNATMTSGGSDSISAYLSMTYGISHTVALASISSNGGFVVYNP